MEQRIQFSGIFNAQGLFDAMLNDYKIGGTSRLDAIKAFSNLFGVENYIANDLLSGDVPYRIEDNTLIFQEQG